MRHCAIMHAGMCMSVNAMSTRPQVVREHYLRDDISSGSPLDPESDADTAKLSADAKQYLVVDTNIVLQQVIQQMKTHPRRFQAFGLSSNTPAVSVAELGLSLLMCSHAAYVHSVSVRNR